MSPEPFQGQHQRRGAHERDDLDAVAVAEGHQCGAGVGHGRQAGFGEQADVLPVEEREQGFHFRGCGVFVEDVEIQPVDVAAQAIRREETPRRAQLLHDEAAQAAGPPEDGLRQDLGGVIPAERSRNQVESARCHCLLCLFR